MVGDGGRDEGSGMVEGTIDEGDDEMGWNE